MLTMKSAEDRIGDLEDRSLAISQTEIQREKS
jgi:hypothetical protein